MFRLKPRVSNILSTTCTHAFFPRYYSTHFFKNTRGVLRRANVPTTFTNQQFCLNSIKKTSTRSYAVERLSKYDVEKIRNIAIIAHVDAGKTTMVDCLLRQTESIDRNADERAMDGMALEKERGITIMSKWTAVQYKDYLINIVDTPGHADFGGEVERILDMVDGVCLLVDATIGVMPQTRFVLSKALQRGLKAIVIVNKCDRENQRAVEISNEVLDLFLQLNATEEQLDFPVLFASAYNGWAVEDLDDPNKKDMDIVFQTIINTIEPPKVDRSAPFKMLATSIEFDKHFGKVMIGKIYAGKIKVNDRVKVLNREGKVVETAQVMKLQGRLGLERVLVKRAYAGDIVALAGLTKASPTDTICDESVTEPLQSVPLDPPIISVVFTINDSPVAGKEGTNCSAIKLRERLEDEAKRNITIQIRKAEGKDSFEVLGRGEMQIGILVETMRREGYEFALSSPKVLIKKNEKGVDVEPYEEVIIDVDNEYATTIIDDLNNRKGDMLDYNQMGEKTRMRFKVPTRLLMGYRSEFINKTRGTGIMNSRFHSYEPYRGDFVRQRKGLMIATAPGGVATAYALSGLEQRGTLFIKPQAVVYEGMIVGMCSRGQDITVNPCKTKHLTNMRAAGSEEAIRLAPIHEWTVEDAMSFIEEDELIEVTPKSIRLRKVILSEVERKVAEREAKKKK